MYYCKLGDVTVVGSSPEALVKVNAAGRAELRPIAGTRPRAEEQAADERHERELLADVKENAEHVMLVDLARKRPRPRGQRRQRARGSVPRHRTLQPCHAHGQRREGPARAGARRLRPVRRDVPRGNPGGRPKVRAMEIIDELEPVRRGLYGGTVGYFGARGDMDQAITIRTLVFRGDEYSYQAGAGIVADSVPAAEHDEVLAKSGAMARALRLSAEGL
jgi:anthranilate synthase component 1